MSALGLGGGAQMSAHQAAGNGMALMNWNPVRASADADTLPDLATLTVY